MTNFRDRLRIPRRVSLNGKHVGNLLQCLEFRGAIDVLERYFHLQDERSEYHLAVGPDGPISMGLTVPNSIDDLRRKRQHYREVAELSFGMMGRTPDFMNAALAALVSHTDVLQSADFAANIQAFHRHVGTANLFVGHAAINPQMDRAKTLHKQTSEFAGIRTVARNGEGIVVSGAKMIVTLAPLTDEIVFFNMPGLHLGDEHYAVAFALPTTHPSLQIFCRKPLQRLEQGGEFDYPIVNRFDEIDAYVVLEKALVPWDRVFVLDDVATSNAFYDQTRARHHTGHQDVTRGLSKAELLCGVALEVANVLGLDGHINIQEKLGELTSSLNLISAAVDAVENKAVVDDKAVCNPDIQSIQAIRYHFPRMYERMIEVIQSFAAGSILAVPHSGDFANGNGEILDAALTSPLLSARHRCVLLNLAWDLTGADFGQRQKVYEYFHAGDPMRIAAGHFRAADQHRLRAVARRALADALPTCAPLT
jgi:4-hydroxyphenylacetate 3-monooxygenase